MMKLPERGDIRTEVRGVCRGLELAGVVSDDPAEGCNGVAARGTVRHQLPEYFGESCSDCSVQLCGAAIGAEVVALIVAHEGEGTTRWGRWAAGHSLVAGRASALKRYV